MLKRLGFTFGGFLLSIGGFILGYICLMGVENGGNMLLLIPSILLICAGVFLLLKAGTMSTAKLPFLTKLPTPPAGETVLDRNNKIVAEWNDTSNTRDKLKMTQAAVAVTEEKV